jgi:hypothetical protein
MHDQISRNTPELFDRRREGQSPWSWSEAEVTIDGVRTGGAASARSCSSASSAPRQTNQGVKTIEIACLPDSIGMQRLAQKFKTHFTFEESSLTGRLTARRPTPVSLLREASGDMADFGASLFDAQVRAVAAARTKNAS